MNTYIHTMILYYNDHTYTYITYIHTHSHSYTNTSVSGQYTHVVILGQMPEVLNTQVTSELTLLVCLPVYLYVCVSVSVCYVASLTRPSSDGERAR